MFDISFSDTSVILVAAPELLGDFDQNGIVDFGDDVLLQNLPGTNNPLPNDGGLGVPIGVPHYELSKANFGGPGLNLVPEPSGMGRNGVDRCWRADWPSTSAKSPGSQLEMWRKPPVSGQKTSISNAHERFPLIPFYNEKIGTN